MDQIKRHKAVARDLGDFDAIVWGGGLSGWAAAVSLGRDGRRVLLASEGTSLGREVASSMSTWWPKALAVPPLWAEVVDELRRVSAATSTVVDPVATQVLLERSAEQAGVELLYAVNAHPGEDEITLLTGRWGLMAARSSVLIDASARGRLAVECGATSQSRKSRRSVIRRALMVKTGLSEPKWIEVGNELPVADATSMAWPGLWPGDAIIEVELDLPMDDMTSLEIASRRAMVEVVSRLRASHEELAQGSLVAVALDPVLPRDIVLEPSADGEELCRLHGDEGEVTVARGMMLPERAGGVIAASPALDLGEISARECYYAPNAVTLGEAAGALAGETLRDNREAADHG